MNYLNKHIYQLKESATLAINQTVKAKRASGQTVYHFGFGQAPFPAHATIVDGIRTHAHITSYMETQGLFALRSQISQFLGKFQGMTARPEQIFIGPGSKELLYQIVLILDTTFLIPKGSWVSYIPQIKSKNAVYKIIDTQEQHQYKVTAEQLNSICHKGVPYTLILNSPNNPTGAVYTEDELKEIALICKDLDIMVMSDEIYSQMNFTDDYAPSISKYLPERTIVFGGLSKVFSGGGYRLGFAVIPDQMEGLKKCLFSLISETYSCVAAPIQHGAIIAYQYAPPLRAYIGQCKAILKAIAQYVHENLSSMGLLLTHPSGGFYMVVSFEPYREQLFKRGISNAKTLCHHLLEDRNIALLPGADFYFDQSSLCCRLAFVDFDGALALQVDTPTKDLSYLKRICPNIIAGVEAIQDFIEDVRAI